MGLALEELPPATPAAARGKRRLPRHAGPAQFWLRAPVSEDFDITPQAVIQPGWAAG
ncbi:hypothetical protein ACIBL3_44745 [Kribbella sp. NPDC050124]|uniref:hypothetical protein n=1 Tax=Kribbella sp. NPDC050124 TaxID=3364114 RepID=UPI0037A8E766